MTDGHAITDRRRADLGRYVPWLARDYFTNHGPATAIVLLLIGFLAFQAVPPGDRATLPRDVSVAILRQLLAAVGFLGPFFATNGIVSNDRKQGTYKFLFSKPVRPTTYYATTFLVHGAGLVLICAALLALWAYAVYPMYPLELLLIVALMYVAYGGIGFLLSAAWRFDWLSLVTVLFVANVAWSFWGRASGIRYWMIHLLPPVHRTGDVYAMVDRAAGAPVAWASIAWLGGYGFACFLLGLVVIRKRPLGTS